MSRYRSLALELRVRCAAGDELCRRLAELYRACETGEAAPVELDLSIDFDDETSDYVLRAGGDVICRTAAVDDLIEWFAWSVNRAAVEQSTHDLLVLHAAGVCRDSRGILLAGPSGAGKSTLVTALTLSGFAYMGEESLGVTSAGALVPNPKPIALDDASRGALSRYSPAHAELANGQGLFAPHALGAVAGHDAHVRPALIVRPAFRPGAAAGATAMSRADAAVLLADQSFNFPARGRAGLRTVAAVARAAPAYTVEFDDLPSAIAVVRDLFDHAVPEAGESDLSDEPVEILGGEAVIWDAAREELHHLSPTATDIWRAARAGASSVSLVDAAVLQTNKPRSEVAAEVEGCIADLVSRNLLP